MMEVVNVEAVESVDVNGSNEAAVQKLLEPLANGTEAEAEQEPEQEQEAEAEQQQPQQGGQPVVGRQLRKKFGRKYFTGTVAEYEPETSWYKVVYEDGDGEDLEWPELEPLLVAKDESKKRRGGAPAKSGSKKRKTKALEEVERPAEEAQQQEAEEAQQQEAEEAQQQEAEEDATDRGEEEGGGGTEEQATTENETEAEDEKPATKPGKKRGKAKKPTKRKAAAAAPKPSSSPRKRARKAEPPATGTPRKSSRLSGDTPVSGVVSSSKRKRGGVKKAPAPAPAPKAKSPPVEKSKIKAPSAAAKGKRVAKAPEAEKSEASTGLDRGEKLKGRRLEKEFDGKVYGGQIQEYDRSRRFYKIQYEDGDEEELVWKELEPLLVPAGEIAAATGGASTSRSSGRKKPEDVKVITKTVRKTKVVHTKKVVTRSNQKKRRVR